MKKDNNSSPTIPEKLQMIVDKTGITIQEIAHFIYEYKEKEQRFIQQCNRDTQLLLKKKQEELNFKRFAVEEHNINKMYDEIFNKPVKKQNKLMFWKKIK
ncbi:MAG: hypothetical protein WC554_12620 [Clostridia bacterium]